MNVDVVSSYGGWDLRGDNYEEIKLTATQGEKDRHKIRKEIRTITASALTTLSETNRNYQLTGGKNSVFFSCRQSCYVFNCSNIREVCLLNAEM